MTAIREFVKLPDYFDYKEVEVVIMPRIDSDDLSYLNDEIEIGMNSGISDKSHEEIF